MSGLCCTVVFVFPLNIDREGVQLKDYNLTQSLQTLPWSELVFLQDGAESLRRLWRSSPCW